MGDGFMASFSSATKAVECAIALQRAFAAREGEPLNVRVGINAGEPIEEEGDLFGATVILASRIAAKAEGGEILVADTVRGLCSGKGFLFADRGEFVAKGFEEPVRVYEVRWQGGQLRVEGGPGGASTGAAARTPFALRYWWVTLARGLLILALGWGSCSERTLARTWRRSSASTGYSRRAGYPLGIIAES